MEINLDKIKERSIEKLLDFSILNIDKPAGLTSFQTAEKVGIILGAKKISHFGTLDPMVTGVLPVAINRACKLSGYFIKKDKTYIGKMHLHSEVEEDKLKNEVDKFIGKIKQKPPVKSRVKRVEREREVYEFEILNMNGKDAEFKVKCEAGTYVRKLIFDLGLKIGGAHMTGLRRISAGIFSENDEEFVNLEDLEKAFLKYKNGDENNLRKLLIPAEEAVKKIMPFAQLQVNERELKQILTGKPIFKNQLREIPQEKIFAVFSGKRFIEIARKSEEGDIIARPEFVFN